MTRRLAALVAVVGVLFAACSHAPLPTGERSPKPCAVVYSVARCQALTDAVAADLGKDRNDVVSVAIVPDAPPGGVHLSAGWHIRVRLALADGSTFDKLMCGGPVHEPACTDHPALEVDTAIDNEVDGVPAGDAAAPPIEVPSMSIPIDHRGSYDIPLGEGSDPGGVWSSGRLQFAVPWPEDVALRGAVVTLDLRTAPEHRRPSLVFDVLWFRPGATLEVRDLIVR